MRIYVSGPMTGFLNQNREAFSAAAAKLRSQGHFAINPHDLTQIFGTEKEIAAAFAAAYMEPKSFVNIGNYDAHCRKLMLAQSVMAADLAAVRSCDAIYLLRGWEKSRGVKKELTEAGMCGLKVFLEREPEKP